VREEDWTEEDSKPFESVIDQLSVSKQFSFNPPELKARIESVKDIAGSGSGLPQT